MLPAVAAPPREDLLERFERFDRRFLSIPADPGAIERYRERLRPCEERTGRELETCVLTALLGEGGLEALDVSTSPRPNSVTGALADGAGSCAALVGAVLALTEPMGSPFKAVVLRKHVLLESASTPGVYYETLDGGRRVSDAWLDQNGPSPPEGPIRVPPDEYVAYYLDNLAARLAAAGEVDEAGQAFREALELVPQAARVRYNYGTFLLQQGRYEEAAAELTRALRLGWRDAPTYVNRGAARWKLGRPKAARRDFEKALKLDPGNREARINLERLDAPRSR